MGNTLTLSLKCLMTILLFTFLWKTPFSEAQVLASSGQQYLGKNTPRNGKEEQKMTLEQVLKGLEKKHQIAIAYRSEILSVTSFGKLATGKDTSPEEDLDSLLKDTQLRYRKAEDGFYIIYRAEEVVPAKKSEGAAKPSSMVAPVLPVNPNATLDRTVTGQVSDEEGNPLPGVNVLEKGTTNGTITDIEGNYRIVVPDEEVTLLFTFVGYRSEEIEVGNRSEINVNMLPDLRSLSEVVVTALGVERDERSLGYGVQEVDPSNMEKAREVNVVNSLAGRISGVQVQGSGNLGGSSRILIRGVNSVTGENQPLFIVDGTPLNNASFNTDNQDEGNTGRDFGNVIQDLNPADIASISVLKGPSASALYGSRGANGVILVTTKKGSRNQGLGIELNSSTMFNNPMRLYDYQNEYGAGFSPDFDEIDGVPYINPIATGSWGPRMEGQMVRHWDSWYANTPEFEETRPFSPNPGNVRDFFNTGVMQSSNLSLSGGGERTRFRMSYTNLYQKGTLENSRLNRNNFNFNGSMNLSEKLTASLSVNYVKSNVVGRPPTGEFTVNNSAQSVGTYLYSLQQRQWDFNRMRDYSAPGYPNKAVLFLPFGSPVSRQTLGIVNGVNPYFILNESFSEDERTRVFGNFSLSYQVNDDLTLQGFARTDFYTNVILDRNYTPYRPNISSFSKNVYNFQENNYEFLATYDKSIGDDFSITANVGANQRVETMTRTFGQTNNGLSVPEFYNLSASVGPLLFEDFQSKRVINSLYGVANFGFRGTLFLEGSLRNDWSSTLPQDNNSFLYPSASASFVFSELFETSDFFSFGKLRAGWAQVGNDTEPYRLGRVYAASQPFDGLPRFGLPQQSNNPNLEPEITESYELGLDMRFFNGRLNMDLTYYDSETRNQIIPLNVSGATGFVSAITNAGVMSNRGYEVQLNGSPISQGDFSWDVSVNFSRNINQLEELGNDGSTLLLASNQGMNLIAEEGEPYGTLFGSSFLRDDNGNRLVDNDGFFIQGPQAPIGNLQPDFLGGINNSISFKGLSLSALIDFQKGGEFYSVSLRDASSSGLVAETVGNNAKGNPKRDPVDEGGGILADGVLESGAQNETYVEALEYYGQLSSIREAWVLDASFVKLREITFGYQLPSSFVDKLSLQSVYVGVVGRNLGLLYAAQPHIDPSQISLGSGNIQGYDVYNLPSERSIGFNVNIKL